MDGNSTHRASAKFGSDNRDLKDVRHDIPDQMNEPDSGIDKIRTVIAAYAALPTAQDIQTLLTDGEAAETRGYYNPVEDERLRETYTRYLGIRVSLWEVIQSLRLSAKRVQRDPLNATNEDWQGFAIAICAAEIIVGTGEYLIDLARNRPIIWRKLDEGDQRYNLPRKSFTRLYRQLTSVLRMHGYYRARDIYDGHREKVVMAAAHQIVEILSKLNLPTASRGDHLRCYRRFVRHSLKRRHISAGRNILFSIFEMMGSDIADLKIPFIKPPKAPKRVSSEVIKNIRYQLQPGDVFVTRHDDAMSNLFLPGFWPHSALWLGGEDADILEAKKDGVLYRNIEDTLQVDAFVVIRPRLTEAQIDRALKRARTHAGKLYDFIFDFRTTDRLVCTEVIYRTYHGIGPIDFDLKLEAGRYCLSAEELLNQGLEQRSFEVVAIYGVGGNDLVFGAKAKEKLRASFKSRF